LQGVSAEHAKIYNTMQGPDEFNILGKFQAMDIWDACTASRSDAVDRARTNEMSPAQIQRMGTLIPHARVVACEKGSHMAMYDDQRAYFDALIPFLHDVRSELSLDRVP